MKKIAYTLFFLITLVVILFSFFLANQDSLSKKTKIDLTEQEHYCLFKGGQLSEKEGIKTCTLNNIEQGIEDFFVHSLREQTEVKEILIKP